MTKSHLAIVGFATLLCGIFAPLAAQNPIPNRLPLVASTWAESINATRRVWELLEEGYDLLDAVEMGLTQMCEEQLCQGGTGPYNKLDESGDFSFDALIMNGDNYDVGAVGGLRNVRAAISVARAVMDYTDHTLIVGDDATKFAEEMQFPWEDFRDETTNATWWEWKNNNCQPNFRKNVTPDPSTSCGPYQPIPDDVKTKKPNKSLTKKKSKKSYKSRDNQVHKDQMRPSLSADPDNHDTVGIIALDHGDHSVVGITTNGLTHKIPGRVGDVSAPGAGGYAVSEFGAATCTGNGDIMIRFLPSFVAMEALRSGKTALEAAQDAMIRINQNNPEMQAAIIVSDSQGDYASACTGYTTFPYVAMNANMEDATNHIVICEESLVRATSASGVQLPSSKSILIWLLFSCLGRI